LEKPEEKSDKSNDSSDDRSNNNSNKNSNKSGFKLSASSVEVPQVAVPKQGKKQPKQD